MLLDKLHEQKDFTASEVVIAEYLLSQAIAISSLSTAELAEVTHTSKATVTRLCRKLGVESYRDFQRILEKEQLDFQRVNAKLNAEPINASTGFEDILRILPVMYEDAIANTTIKLDKTLINQVVQKVGNAKKVDIYGSGVTQAIAQLTAFKFSTLGIECGTYSGLNEHYILADRNPKEKAIIIFSLTGANPNMIYVAQWLKKRHYYILGIGGDAKAVSRSFARITFTPGKSPATSLSRATLPSSNPLPSRWCRRR